MSEDQPGNVVHFRSGAPSARIKELAPDDKRANCQHKQVLIWRSEPVMECKSCGALVDPYWWLRQRIRDWTEWQEAERYKCEGLERERDNLRKQIRILRAEYRDEVERRAAEREAERAIAVLPPQRRAKR